MQPKCGLARETSKFGKDFPHATTVQRGGNHRLNGALAKRMARELRVITSDKHPSRKNADSSALNSYLCNVSTLLPSFKGVHAIMAISHTIISASALLVVLVRGQDVPAFPASEEVSGESVSGAQWSPAERVQLTDNALTAIDEELPDLSALWAFDDGEPGGLETGDCRSFPGDESWPSSEVWETFDKLLGEGALIPTVPLAAACYDSWSTHDEEECAFVQENFGDPYLQ